MSSPTWANLLMGSDYAGSKDPESLSLRLKGVLEEIHQEQWPHLPNPPGCKKRASVSLVIRIRPAFTQEAVFDKDRNSSSLQPFQTCLDSFFSQPWVQHGDPEVLLIKRAARAGDRWTSHIALPGGKMEPDDADDRATSVRETMEETGLELNTDHCLYVGNLPERVIKVMWGETPIMVLCPFVYLLMRHDIPPLALQPSEIHSAHWVPLRALLSPSLRRTVRSNATERSNRRGLPGLNLLVRATAGQMIFGAVKLKPTESLYCSSLPSYIPENNTPNSLTGTISHKFSTAFLADEDPDEQPLLLWGLTLSIIADVLQLIDAKAASKLWSWPTFSPWDIRLTIWLLTYRFRSRKLQELTTRGEKLSDVQTGGMDSTTFTTSAGTQSRRSKTSEAGAAALQLLDGYSEPLRRAVLVALVLRLAVGGGFAAYLLRRHRTSRL